MSQPATSWGRVIAEIFGRLDCAHELARARAALEATPQLVPEMRAET